MSHSTFILLYLSFISWGQSRKTIEKRCKSWEHKFTYNFILSRRQISKLRWITSQHHLKWFLIQTKIFSHHLVLITHPFRLNANLLAIHIKHLTPAPHPTVPFLIFRSYWSIHSRFWQHFQLKFTITRPKSWMWSLHSQKEISQKRIFNELRRQGYRCLKQRAC